MNRRYFLRGGAAISLGGTGALLDVQRGVRAKIEEHSRGSSAEDYLLDPAVTYLNHGSIGTVPRLVHDAHVRYLALCEENLCPGAPIPCPTATPFHVVRMSRFMGNVRLKQQPTIGVCP